MHLNGEVLVINEAFPLGKDLSLAIPPILCEEVIKAFDRPVSSYHAVSPLHEAKLHVFLPVTCQAEPHPVQFDLLAELDLLVNHVVF